MPVDGNKSRPGRTWCKDRRYRMKSGQGTCEDNRPPPDSTPRNTLESGFNILERCRVRSIQTHHKQRRNWASSEKKESEIITKSSPTTKRLSSNTNLTEQRLGKKLEVRRKEAKRRGKSYSIWRERKTMAKEKKKAIKLEAGFTTMTKVFWLEETRGWRPEGQSYLSATLKINIWSTIKKKT